MSLNNIATQIPDIAFTTPPSIDGKGTASLLDLSQNNFANNPYFAWINTPTNMKITDMCANDMSMNLQNLMKWGDYGHAMFDGIGSATTTTNGGQPLGNRYFMPAAARSGGINNPVTKKCVAPNGTKVDQYYVVDGMAKQQGVDKSGLFFSARGTVDNIDSQNIAGLYKSVGDTSFYDVNTATNINYKDAIQIKPLNPLQYDSCVNAKLVVDGTGKTETNYVSKREFEDLKAKGIATEAFQSRSGSLHQQSPMIVRGHDGSWGQHHPHHVWSRSESGTDFGGYVIGGDIVFPSQSIVLDTTAPIMYTTAATTPIEVETDNYYRAWMPESNALTRERSRTMAKKGYDAITGFFLGSITVVGLFIVFQLIDRSPSRIRR